jgi:septal ring factor EnvC (AmiA/AmiB activator)
MTLDEQYELLKKRAYFQGERQKTLEQLATWEKNVESLKAEIADHNDKIAALEAMLAKKVT